MTDDPARGATRRRLARSAARDAGPALDATAIAAAAGTAYDDFARVLTPLIGGVGIAAITDRALHLAAREYPWLPAGEPASPDTQFPQVTEALKRQDDPAVAAAAATAVFEAILDLLATFIGEPLAARLVRQAWPDAASSAHTTEA